MGIQITKIIKICYNIKKGGYMKIFKTEVAIIDKAINKGINNYLAAPKKEIVDKNEYIFFTAKEEEFLSKKLISKGEIVNITEEDFFNL